MYKVFFKDRVVFLGNVSESSNFKGRIFVWEEGVSLENLIDEFEACPEEESVFIAAGQVNELFGHFKNCFTYIEAAGGKVFNSDDQLLVIYRLNKWDLPKGKVEEGESLQEAAIREVEEECGVTGVEVVKELNSTYHTYRTKKKHMLKRTYWYQMIYRGSETLIPQIKEDIELAKWLSPDDLLEFRSNTYASILEVVDGANID